MAPLGKSIDAGIRYDSVIPGNISPYVEWEAGTLAGLDMWKWESGGYPPDFMERTVAFYLTHQNVRNHQDDAVREHVEQKAKRKS